MASSLYIELAFFDGEELLCRGELTCEEGAGDAIELSGEQGYRFTISGSYKEPACPVSITSMKDNQQLYKSALQVGVHTSED
jgi:hypothetical protein